MSVCLLLSWSLSGRRYRFTLLFLQWRNLPCVKPRILYGGPNSLVKLNMFRLFISILLSLTEFEWSIKLQKIIPHRFGFYNYINVMFVICCEVVFPQRNGYLLMQCDLKTDTSLNTSFTVFIKCHNVGRSWDIKARKVLGP